ncbi:MAG: amidohydrolase [Azonexus sp.]|jgi:predicted TIM-barrel fold metal-dependent hydrolase|nr:amidohydrolase [Azonexus sp.]
MTNRPFTFSCDAHVVEPLDLYTSNLPAHLQDYALSNKIEDNFLCSYIGNTQVYRIPANIFDQKVGAGVSFGDAALMKPRGSRDLRKRLEDMERDGIDAELIYPTTGLLAARITNREAAVATAKIWNDWVWDYFDGLRNKFVPAAFLPLTGFEELIAEMKRCLAKGFKALMLPPIAGNGMPAYNDPGWDAVFGPAGEAGATFVMHTATGEAQIKAVGGPGGAIYNYTRQMCDAIDATVLLTAGGVLDRNPKSRIMFAECGAAWLLPTAERMDEVYHGHSPFVKPKLNRLPSQIVKDQVYATFQNDVGALDIRREYLNTIVFSSDYPHSEGTFPFTQKVLKEGFAKIPGITDQEIAQVLGLNAAKVFQISPQKAAQESEQYLKAAA